MGRKAIKPRRFSCFTPEQQKFYEELSERHRKYVEYRGQGYSKTQAYKMAGYYAKNLSQSAHNLEANNAGIAELIQVLLSAKRVWDVVEGNEETQANSQLDAIASQEGVEQAIKVLEGADGETARRIQFYRDIATGKIKTKKTTTHKNAEGAVMKVVVEEISDIDSRIKARKELDKILGLNSVVNLDKLQVGDITINIVDASCKQELEDERNIIDISDESEEKPETLDEQKFIPEEVTQIDSNKSKFFETVSVGENAKQSS